MGTDVLIQLTSIIRNINDEEEINRHKAKGKIYIKDNEIYLRYKEGIELGNTWTIIEWNSKLLNRVKIVRQGDIKADQIFQKGYIHDTFYQSPHGRFAMRIITKDINLYMDHKESNIYLDYDLLLDNQKLGEYKVEIKFYTLDDNTSKASFLFGEYPKEGN